MRLELDTLEPYMSFLPREHERVPGDDGILLTIREAFLKFKRKKILEWDVYADLLLEHDHTLRANFIRKYGHEVTHFWQRFLVEEQAKQEEADWEKAVKKDKTLRRPERNSKWCGVRVGPSLVLNTSATVRYRYRAVSMFLRRRKAAAQRPHVLLVSCGVELRNKTKVDDFLRLASIFYCLADSFLLGVSDEIWRAMDDSGEPV